MSAILGKDFSIRKDRGLTARAVLVDEDAVEMILRRKKREERVSMGLLGRNKIVKVSWKKIIRERKLRKCEVNQIKLNNGLWSKKNILSKVFQLIPFRYPFPCPFIS